MDNSRQLAVKYVEYLTAAVGSRSTQQIFSALSIVNDHNKARFVLRRLVTTGVISATSTTPTMWRRIAEKPFDPANPFKGETPIEKKSKPAKGVDASLLARIDSLERQLNDLTGGTTDKSDDTATVQALATLATRLKKLEERSERVNVTLEVKSSEGAVKKLKNVTLPKVFPDVLSLVSCRRNILLIGPAGCGKTHMGKLAADAVDLEFGSLSCTAGMSETHFLGRSIPNLATGKSDFQGTDFLRLYEGGGVFLLDEMDAADSNTLLCVNSALANGYCNVPNRPKTPRAIRHKDFVLIATANTFGRGANRMYVGRNQLDEATLDRFRIGTIECNYDEAVEAAVCPDNALRGALTQVRGNIEAGGMRRIMSTRFMQDAYLMHKAAGWKLTKILEVYFEGWTSDEKSRAMLGVPTTI